MNGYQYLYFIEFLGFDNYIVHIKIIKRKNKIKQKTHDVKPDRIPRLVCEPPHDTMEPREIKITFLSMRISGFVSTEARV